MKPITELVGGELCLPQRPHNLCLPEKKNYISVMYCALFPTFQLSFCLAHLLNFIYLLMWHFCYTEHVSFIYIYIDYVYVFLFF